MNSEIIIIIMVTLITIITIQINSQNNTNTENFAWSCTWTPNVDYYKEDWLLGDNPVVNSIVRGSIQGPIYT